MSHARTIWEEGHEPGRRVVVLGVALALTVASLDLLLSDRVGILFDLVFALLSLGLALMVHPRDFFVVGVLPPLLMVGLFLLLGVTRPEAIAQADDGVVQAVVSGLGHHSISLFIGYALCLGCLAMRRHVLAERDRCATDGVREDDTLAV
jgi:hypothetical protein